MKQFSLTLSVVVSAVAGSTLGYFLPASPSGESSSPIVEEQETTPLEQTFLLVDQAVLFDKDPEESDLHYELQSIASIRGLAQWNPKRALAVALHYQEKTGQTYLLKEALSQWAKTDSEKAVSELLTQSKELQDAVFSSVVETILFENPTGCIHMFESGIIERCDADHLQQAFKLFAVGNSEEAARWILENEEVSSEIDQVLQPFFGALGGLETIISVLGPEFSSRITVTPELLWSILGSKYSNPEAAKEFAKSISDPLAKSVYNMAIARDLMNTDLSAAVEHFVNNVSSTLEVDAVSSFSGLLASADLSMALELAEQMIPVEQLPFTLAGVLNVAASLGNSISEDVMQEYIDVIGMLDPEDVTGMIMMPLINIGQGDGDVIAWVSQLSDDHEDLKSVVLYNSARSNIDINPRLASEALAAFPPGGRGDHMVMELVKMLPDDPERALQWTSFMSDPELRVRALENVTTMLQSYDSADAVEWIDTMPLTLQEKVQLRTAVTSGVGGN